MIQALIFDFDGLIIDSETPAFESWCAIYREYGHELSLDLWQAALGRSTGEGFNPLDHLAALVGPEFDPVAVGRRRYQKKFALCEHQPLRPGVGEILAEAQALGLPRAVASSNTRDWVEQWLQWHGIRHQFHCIRASEDVSATKPAPDLFLSAAQCLGVTPSACLVFEDSPNGALAARAAGMRCVVVPCPIAAQLPRPPADLVLPALNTLPLKQLLTTF